MIFIIVKYLKFENLFNKYFVSKGNDYQIDLHIHNQMKSYLHIYFCFALFFCACSSEKETNTKLEENTTPIALSKNQPMNDNTESKSPQIQKSEKKDTAITQKEEKIKPIQISSAHQLLLNRLDKSVPIDYAPLDFEILKNDTLVKAKKGLFHISYATSSLNDSLVAQEIHDFNQKLRKGYLISHNYQTNISIKLNGKNTGSKIIEKALFRNKVDKDFLDKSIIKHPQFLRFDEEKNEAIFEFILGVPNTDWLVVAGINLNEYGSIRIIDIIMPGM